MFGIQFYPTPPDLVDKMLEKIDWSKVTSVLEPSAGKGDILDGIKRLKNSTTKIRYYILKNHVKGISGWKNIEFF